MSDAQLRYEAVGSSMADAVSAKMFGKPCFKTGGKAFMSFWEDSAVFKLPLPERDEALSKPGAVLFDPSGKGRPMKEWVQVPFAHAADWERFAAAAFGYVKSGAE